MSESNQSQKQKEILESMERLETSLKAQEARLAELGLDIEKIQARNKRVEGDKAWETSPFRKIAIALITYFAAALLFKSIGSEKPFLDALIPSGAYILSVQTLPFLKSWWLKNRF